MWYPTDYNGKYIHYYHKVSNILKFIGKYYFVAHTKEEISVEKERTVIYIAYVFYNCTVIEL